jgi:tripartite-type tricarboxylate transporter receptor subunit TctC
MKKILIALLAMTSAAFAQNYPNKAITIVVPFAAGGPTDVISRIMGEHMSRTLGQAVIIENIAGAGGTSASLKVSKSTPDGYTIMMGNLGTHSASVGLYPTLAYDPRTDFTPIINTAGTPMLISAHKDFPAKNLPEFIALLKANPSKYNYGHGGVGSTSHLTCVFFHHLIGAPVQHVPFRGSGPAMTALLGKQLDYVCDQSVGIIPQLTNL